GQHVTQFAPLVDRAGRWHADMAGDASRCGELTEETTQAGLVLGNLWIDFRVTALEIDVRDQRRPAVSRSGQVDRVDVLFSDQSIEMDIDKAQAGRSTPMTQEPRFDVLGE